uniref:Uncharacterized protein n=1 Tax=Anguilla anguilla TaxID=7936 RepID=A0A0E9RQK4_ANGAN
MLMWLAWMYVEWFEWRRVVSRHSMA